MYEYDGPCEDRLAIYHKIRLWLENQMHQGNFCIVFRLGEGEKGTAIMKNDVTKALQMRLYMKGRVGGAIYRHTSSPMAHPGETLPLKVVADCFLPITSVNSKVFCHIIIFIINSLA